MVIILWFQNKKNENYVSLCYTKIMLNLYFFWCQNVKFLAEMGDFRNTLQNPCNRKSDPYTAIKNTYLLDNNFKPNKTSQKMFIKISPYG